MRDRVYAAIHISNPEPAAQIALFALAQQFSPLVEMPTPATALFAIGALRRLMGAPPQIASEMARRAQERRLHGSIAIAANPDTAVIAARHLAGITVIPAGQEIQRLGHLPVNALPANANTLDVLQRWGVRTVEEFCALPRTGIAERLGPEGLRLLAIARGEVHRPIQPQAATVSYEEHFALEHPVDLLEPLLFLLARLLNELCERLRQHSRATTEVRVALALVDQSTHTRVLALPFATHDAHALLKLVQLDLEAHPPRTAIRQLTVALTPVEPRVVQHHLYTPPSPVPERLALTLTKIRAMVGEEKAGFPELLDTHRPDAWRMRSSAGRPSAPLVHEEGREFGLRLALRYFRPPLPARVEVDRGRPAKLAAAGIAGRIVQAAGPWRASGDWWSHAAWSREDWDVALTDGALYRLSLLRTEWLVDASYD
ncbi:MAG: hypothetical protein K2X03_31345 [Bryobacteraceae bacterium]|nr:hypothetical protein [Bryobacteraceae bacterium]